MTELVICSGKGGTGKTSVAAALAELAARSGEIVLADCDVDAANLHLLLEPDVQRTTPFMAGHTAVIDPDLCTGCGECLKLCRFEAVVVSEVAGRTVCRVDPLACEGCGVCVRFCPTAAIAFPEARSGRWHRSRTHLGTLVHAELAVGAENSGKLVTLVREQARREADRQGCGLVLVDGPPGIGCPATAALTGADLVLLVTEPGLSGLHDLQRILDLADHFGVPAAVCINKHDLSPALTARSEQACRERGIPVIGKIPFAPQVNQAQAAGRNLIEFAPDSAAALAIGRLWQSLEPRLGRQPQPKG